MSNVTSTSRLQRIGEKLRTMGEAARKSLTGTLAHTGKQLIDQEFERSEGPDGAAWASLKGSSRAPLVGRRRLWRDLVVTPTADGIKVRAGSIPEEIFRAHNEGAEIPPRQAAPREMSINPRTGRFLSDARARRRKLVFVAPTPARFRGFRLARRQIMPDVVPARWGEAFNATGRAWLRAYLEAR